ncbi:hypothetical protein [Donghicola tyrosinivorans]|uniref:Uncharacterized protein n=1 Tax=Donghicola tyrosinivorans TaxID=1652492 RepID=A0A2T0WYE7_9RHOB|nr:hypothetical protein [Donghicola tyrosinivorans]PRY91718.1 hypothetical protein CLV74_103307 [Donghicola tyrosinivorans]
MKKTLLTLTLSASLVISGIGSAAQAGPQNKDNTAMFVGLAALAALGVALNQKKQKEEDAREQRKDDARRAAERERQRQMAREQARQAELDRQRYQEQERYRHAERQRHEELERQRQIARQRAEDQQRRYSSHEPLRGHDVIKPPRYQQQFNGNPPLPQQCLEVVNASRGDQVMYRMNCLAQNGINLRELPGECIRTVQHEYRARKVTGYDPRCLTKNGVDLARR